jgi:hypothetical protein
MPHVPEPFGPGKTARLAKAINSLDRLADRLRDSVDRAQQLLKEMNTGAKRGGRTSRGRKRNAR